MMDEEKAYLFNVETTVLVKARTPEDAWDQLNDNKGEITDRDVMLVLVEDRAPTEAENNPNSDA